MDPTVLEPGGLGGLSFAVYSPPATKGSMRPVRNKHTGRIYLLEQVTKSKPFREAVKFAALDAIHGTSFQTLTCPVEVTVVFCLAKPQRAPKRRLIWPTGRRSGDVEKLLRNLFDALTDAGVVGDDAQIVKVVAEKAYVGQPPAELGVPGATVIVIPLPAWVAQHNPVESP